MTTKTNSIRQMLASKEAKAADAVKVDYRKIHIDKDFNSRDKDDRLEQHILEMLDFYEAGGNFPALEVYIRPEGGVGVVEGHCRHEVYKRALKRKKREMLDKDGIFWVPITTFSGDLAKRIARTGSAQAGLPLTAMEFAVNVCQRLVNHNWTVEQIAREVGKTPEHVRNMLKLAAAPAEIKEMVADKTVSPTEAVKQIKAKGGAAAAKALVEKAKEAKKAGKKKVTAKTMTKGATAKRENLKERDVHAAMFRFLLEHAHFEHDLLMGHVVLTISLPEHESPIANLEEATKLALTAQSNDTENQQ